MIPPKDRDALIELMARAFCEKLHGKYFAPFDSHYQAAAEALATLERKGCFVGPVVATYGLDKMSGAGAEAIPAAEGISGYAGQIACRVWTAMQSANPYRAPMKQHTLKLFSHKPKVQHWRDVIRRQDYVTSLLRDWVSSATKQGDSNGK